MVHNPPENFPRIAPYLLVEDVDAELDWLADVLGFEVTVRMPGEDGKTVHGEVRMKDGHVMVGRPSPDYRNPKHLGGATVLVSVYVDDVDEHHRHAKDKGANIIRELNDEFYGDRVYGVEDPEGHHWHLAQHTRDVAPEDMHP